MKLRTDLLKHLTAEDLAEAAERDVHRFEPQPLFSQTGTGSLSSAFIQRACARGGAQHGLTAEAGGACGQRWEVLRRDERSLISTFDDLRDFHRRAPFLFFNGNTFATIGRELALVLFSDLPPLRKREVSSAVAHYIAGVLDRESMMAIAEGMCEAVRFAAGDRVRTLKGSARGVVTAVLEDRRIRWRADSGTELVAPAESLCHEEHRS